MIITFLHPAMTMEHLGFLPSFLNDADPRPMREQFNEHYQSGWQKMHGLTLVDGRSLHYPGDPLMEPVAKIELEDGRKEFVCFYEHDIVAIIQPDLSFEACRMD